MNSRVIRRASLFGMALCVIVILVAGCRVFQPFDKDDPEVPMAPTTHTLDITKTDIVNIIASATASGTDVSWKPETTAVAQEISQEQVQSVLSGAAAEEKLPVEVAETLSGCTFKEVANVSMNDLPDDVFNFENAESDLGLSGLDESGDIIPGARRRGSARASFTLPTAMNWANRNGVNWITPVRDQGPYGTCVTFATVAALESHYRIARNSPTDELDLSESYLWHFGTQIFPGSDGRRPSDPLVGG
ncbi:MAG TPA: C1 family peptidase [Candidatus Ozemobacteraceae bacterium]|nr:C1 family peptidase [Candidatus Ozemobacteraceae bacterium]